MMYARSRPAICSMLGALWSGQNQTLEQTADRIQRRRGADGLPLISFPVMYLSNEAS
jgi:hypothetical protein